MEGDAVTKELSNIENDDLILDIGPKTIKINNIIDSSKTILWNGPAGYFENPNFSVGFENWKEKYRKINQIKSFLICELEVILVCPS